jgi:hypothetical protein
MNSKLPPIVVSNNFANMEAESNSGRQHQSILPVFDTKAALLQFPMIP